MTARSCSDRRSSGCVPHRIAAPASCPIRSRSCPPSISSTGSRTAQSNYLARVVFPKPTRELRIEVDLVAEMAVLNPFDFFLEAYARKIPFRYERRGARAGAVSASPARQLPAGEISRRHIARTAGHRRFSGRAESTPRGRSEVRDPHGAGRAITRGDAARSARDRAATRLSSWCRSCAIWASPRDSFPATSSSSRRREAARGARRARARTSPTCMPGAKSTCPAPGWIGLDATSGLLTGEGHIPLACTPDTAIAAPLTGASRPARPRSNIA